MRSCLKRQNAMELSKAKPQGKLQNTAFPNAGPGQTMLGSRLDDSSLNSECRRTRAKGSDFFGRSHIMRHVHTMGTTVHQTRKAFNSPPTSFPASEIRSYISPQSISAVHITYLQWACCNWQALKLCRGGHHSQQVRLPWQIYPEPQCPRTARCSGHFFTYGVGRRP
jgi:hypothetical protein